MFSQGRTVSFREGQNIWAKFPIIPKPELFWILLGGLPLTFHHHLSFSQPAGTGCYFLCPDDMAKLSNFPRSHPNIWANYYNS